MIQKANASADDHRNPLSRFNADRWRNGEAAIDNSVGYDTGGTLSAIGNGRIDRVARYDTDAAIRELRILGRGDAYVYQCSERCGAEHIEQFWKPDIDYWSRLSKATLMAALADAPGMNTRGERTRADITAAHPKLRKSELAAKISVMFDGAGYLPDVLVTPLPPGALALTPAAIEALERPSVAAE